MSVRLRYLAALAAVALGAAAFAIAFRALLHRAFAEGFGVVDVVSLFRDLPAWQCLALPAAGGILAGAVARLAARWRQGHGVGDVMEAIVLGGVHLSLRATLLKSLGSWFAIVGGGSIGREGPLIQFGGTFGELVARWFAVDADRARSLMAAGTAAGFAAAYNTPLAAVLFVLEIVTGIVALDAILAAVVGAALATAATRSVLGAGPIYGERMFTLVSQAELAGYAVLGVLAAGIAQGFMRLVASGERWFAASRVPQPWRAGLGGLLVGAIAIALPEVTGNGYEPLDALLDGRLATAVVLALLLAKAIATTASVASGSPGGVFTPTLFLGAAFGVCFHHGLSLIAGPAALGSPGAYALVGMAATTAATTHAPMMAAVLVFELSGDYAIVVPLLIATAAATALSRLLRKDSIYGAELRRRGVTWELSLDGRRVIVE